MSGPNSPILPGPETTLGMLGGGQLGRMFAQAAQRMGYRVHVFAPEEHAPAGDVAELRTRAAYEDEDAVAEFARDVDVVSFEFENVPAATVAAAERFAPVRPSGALLHAAQNRAREKRAMERLGLPVAVFAQIDAPEDLAPASERVGFPAILKTAASGYDGKGQARVEDAAGLQAAWTRLGAVPTVLERVVPFVEELSIVGARALDGSVALYEPVLNHHENHILDLSLCPAGLAPATVDAAREIGRAVLEGFDVVGVLCVELFLLEDGSLLVNEIAPRPHNSGHLTIDAHAASQFEQQVRAVCGLPLGSCERTVPAAAMANLLGDLWGPGGEHVPDWSAALATPGTHLHLYGKQAARPGRKMGHLTVTGATPAEVERVAREARDRLPRSVQPHS